MVAKRDPEKRRGSSGSFKNGLLWGLNFWDDGKTGYRLAQSTADRAPRAVTRESPQKRVDSRGASRVSERAIPGAITEDCPSKRENPPDGDPSVSRKWNESTKSCRALSSKVLQCGHLRFRGLQSASFPFRFCGM